MAYEIIKTHIFGETTYSAVVGNKNVKMFPGGKYWFEVIVKQQRNINDGTSDFIGELWVHVKPNEVIQGITYEINSDVSSHNTIDIARERTSKSGLRGYGDGSDGVISALMVSDDTTVDIYDYRNVKAYHDVNGVYKTFKYTSSANNTYTRSFKNIINVNGLCRPTITAYYHDEVGEEKDKYTILTDVNNRYNIEVEPLTINKGVVANVANDFTDEENASFSYTAQNLYHAIEDTSTATTSDRGVRLGTITSLQVALSLDGVNPNLIGYRDVPVDGTSYTFNFTEQDRLNIQTLVQGSSVVPVYYLIKTVREVSIINDNWKTITETGEHITAAKRTLTIVGCNPTLNPTVKDIKEETLALTGNENTVVRYESMVEYAVNATASKSAEIVSQSVQCGSKIVSNLPYGVIDDVESNIFIFKATDSRNLRVEKVIQKNLIAYVKPTCYQDIKMEVSGETGAKVIVKVSGSYFNGSFGKVNNTLKLEIRYTNDSGTMSGWQTLTGTPTFNSNTYELTATFEGFTYSKAYTFQCRATDKLNFVNSSQYELRMYPVFDWGEEDFNFNVPVKMDGETVLRHNKTAKNTVLASSGNNVYIRPNGDENTSGELQIKTSGDVKVNGGLEVAGSIKMAGKNLNIIDHADYITATGTASMGSNGTWYWQKWNSGKAECYGCRNFGNMAITTAWGNLYRSAVFTQDLPSGLFNAMPDVININMINSSYGGWICRHEQTAPSAYSTGSFIYVRPASATATPTNIGFHVIGRWK